MSKSLSWTAIEKAMKASPNLAKTGTSEQRAGMFKPSPPAKPASTAPAKR
jgi:hypothetical protein